MGMDIGGRQTPCLLYSPAHEAKGGKNVLLEGIPEERCREGWEGKKRGWASSRFSQVCGDLDDLEPGEQLSLCPKPILLVCPSLGGIQVLVCLTSNLEHLPLCLYS